MLCPVPIQLPAEPQDQLDLSDRQPRCAGDDVGGRAGIREVPDGGVSLLQPAVHRLPVVGGREIRHGDEPGLDEIDRRRPAAAARRPVPDRRRRPRSASNRAGRIAPAARLAPGAAGARPRTARAGPSGPGSGRSARRTIARARDRPGRGAATAQPSPAERRRSPAAGTRHRRRSRARFPGPSLNSLLGWYSQLSVVSCQIVSNTATCDVLTRNWQLTTDNSQL